jgi:hypothetical protein
MAERNVIFNFVANTSSLLRGTDQATAAMKKMSRAWDESIGKLTGPVASAITGAGLLIAAKKVGDFEEKVRRMGVATNMTAKGIMELKTQLLSTALATGNTTDQMSDLAQAALKTSKSSKFVTENLGFMANVMKASGVSGSVLGAAMGEIHEKTGLVGKDFETLIDNMYKFGKTSGRESTFGDILGNIGPLMETYKSAGMSTKLADVNAFLTTAMFVPNPQSMAKAMRKMQTSGQKGLAELGFNMSKGVPAIEKVVAKLAKIKDLGLQSYMIGEIFGPNALINIQKLIKESDEFNKSMEESRKTSGVMEDARRATVDLTTALNRLQTVGFMVFEKMLKGPLEEFTNQIEKMVKSGEMDQLVTKLEYAAKGFLALWAAIKVGQGVMLGLNLVRGFGGLFGAVGGGGGKGGPGLGAIGSVSNPMYVIVVAGPMGGGGIPGKLPPGAPAAGGALATAGAIGLIAAPVVAAGVLAYMANKELNAMNSPEAYKKRVEETGVYSESGGPNSLEAQKYSREHPKLPGLGQTTILNANNSISVNGEKLFDFLTEYKIKGDQFQVAR